MYGSTHVEARQMSKGNFRRRAPNFSSQEDPLLSVSAFSLSTLLLRVCIDGIHFDYS